MYSYTLSQQSDNCVQPNLPSVPLDKFCKNTQNSLRTADPDAGSEDPFTVTSTTAARNERERL